MAMPTNPLPSVLHAALTHACRGCPLRTDAELLSAFASAGDETAFAELVRRHGRLVLGVSRRMVGDRSAAEDVFQAAFLLLAQKAGVVSWGPTVGPWLYKTARRIAARERVRAGRISVAPIGADIPAPPVDPSTALAWVEVRAALDDALATLPARLREPLVLCYLEGLTQDEAAAALGCSTTTIKGRVARGRERLRQILAKRGLSLSAALAGPLVAESASAAEVAAATARAAAVFRATGVVPPALRALLRGTPLAWKLAAGLLGLTLACMAAAPGLAYLRVQTGSRITAVAPLRAIHPADVFGDPLPPGAVARLGTRRLNGFSEPTGVLFSPDGKKVAAVGPYGITIWDAADGRKLVERTDCNVAPHAAGWRADGTGIAVVQLRDGTWFVSAFTDPGEKLPSTPATLPRGLPATNIRYLALSPDGNHVAVVQGHDDKQFSIDLLPATPGRRLSSVKPERTLGPFPGPCWDVRYTAGSWSGPWARSRGRVGTFGAYLVTMRGPTKGKDECTVTVVDPRRNQIVRTSSIPIPAHSERSLLSLSHDARLAAIPPPAKDNPKKTDGTLRVWDLEAGKEVWSLPLSPGGYGTGHAFTPDGKRLVTSTQEHYVQLWDLAGRREAARAPVKADRIYSTGAAAVAFSPDGRRFATARRDGRVDVWDSATAKAMVPLATHRDNVDGVALSPDGRLAATLAYDDAIRVWDVATGKPVCAIQAPWGKDQAAWEWTRRRPAFTPDGRGLLFAISGELTLADPATGKSLALPAGLRRQRGRVGAFSADGRTLATYSENKVNLWNWPAGTLRATVVIPLAPGGTSEDEKHSRIVGVNSLQLSPDGRLLFTNSIRWAKVRGQGASHNANDIWDARTGKHLHRLAKPDAWYAQSAFAPDGRVMYLGGHGIDQPDAGRMRFDALTTWDPAAGKVLSRHPNPDLIGHQPNPDLGRHIKALAVSPNGRLLAVSLELPFSSDVWLCESKSGRVIKKLYGHYGCVTDLDFSPDGRRLVSVSEDQTGLVWDVSDMRAAPPVDGDRSR
jgi:RNA polymerase sigma factor (sigma-70 family)